MGTANNPGGRFTPTCVGTTRSGRRAGTGPSVHPHVCGDDCRGSRCLRQRIGSPPRVWGRPSLTAVGENACRFTPTCVGTTGVMVDAKSRTPVHPHVCGDDSPAKRMVLRPVGSPPRVWGRLTLEAHVFAAGRFTPTCVGTTGSTGASLRLWSVHPHVCGDDRNGYGYGLGFCGSPPRVWGRPVRGWRAAAASRFTPTCVGTTCRARQPRLCPAVHPHVCGDDGWPARSVACTFGSPPRVWGRLEPVQQDLGNVRFTPTCVGTTRIHSALRRSLSVHPHVCGDDCFLIRDWILSFGSPPRVWGRQAHAATGDGGVRFTPTCVGTTRIDWLFDTLLIEHLVHPHVCGDDRC